MAGQRLVMHVDLDAYFAAVEQVRDPWLVGKPVIVGGDPDGRGVVSTASYEARVFGVRSGMPLRTAKRLCPQGIFVRGDFNAYQRVSGRFHAMLRDFSPLVEPGGLDEAYLDLTGCEAVIEGRNRIAPGSVPPLELAKIAGEEIRRRVRGELALTASVGIASGRSVAKVASDAAKPDGLLFVAPGMDAAFLAPRPVRDLPGLGPKAESALKRVGVQTIGELGALTPPTLEMLFGKWGPILGERARGIDPTPVGEGRGEAKSVSREGTYAQDITNPALLRASLRGYAESVGADLRRMGRRARTVVLKLRYGDFTTITRSRTLDHATHSDDELYETGAWLLGAALSQDGWAVRLLGLGGMELVEDTMQLTLFDDKSPQLESLLGAVDRLREKYGHRALQTGRTFFDPYAGGDEWEPRRRTGLSSRLGRDPGAGHG